MWLTNIDWLLFIFSTAEMIWAMQKLLIYLLFFGAIMHDIYFEEKRDWVISGSCGSGGKVGRLVVRRLLVWIPDSPATVYLLLSAHRSALSASVSGKIFFPTRLREEGRKSVHKTKYNMNRSKTFSLSCSKISSRSDSSDNKLYVVVLCKENPLSWVSFQSTESGSFHSPPL